MMNAYDDMGRRWSLENIIRAHADGRTWMPRLYQIRDNLNRVQSTIIVRYTFNNPVSWRQTCLRNGHVNHDMHEARDWRKSGCQPHEQWMNIRYRMGEERRIFGNIYHDFVVFLCFV